MTDANLPMGLGFRVPLLIVSPWTRGNVVVSEVFDHVSVIKFIEERFNVRATPLLRVIVKFTVKHAVCMSLRRFFDCEFDYDSQEWSCSKSETYAYES